MFLVKLYNDFQDNEGILIHSPFVDDLKLSEGRIKQASKEIWQFYFSINPHNPAWGKINLLQSIIRVFNYKTGEEEFSGRILRPTQILRSDGMLNIKYECESFLAFLQDSSQRHGEYRNITPRQFLQVIIDNHNRQVEPHKQMKLGTVTVTNSTDNVYRYLGYESTLDTIKDKLLSRLGGFLRLREEPGGFYLDYLDSVGKVSLTEIRLRRNLKEMQREIDPRDVITRVVPLGTRIESDDPDAVDASEARLTIDAVNNGVDYLDIPALQNEFGIIEGAVIFDDVNVPNILKTRGEQFIESQHAALVSYKLTPVDLYLINQDIEGYTIDNYYRVVNELFGIDETLQIVQKEINVLDATDISLVIGDVAKTLADYQIEASRSSEKVIDLENIVTRQAQRITGLLEQINNAHSEITNINEIISKADLPQLNEAVTNLNKTVENLNKALEDIPVYGPVTYDENGLAIAQDKIDHDQMKVKLDLITILSNINLDDLKTKLDLLFVTQPVDIDQLYEDVQELKGSDTNG